ncbi:sigma 54-interacting transcriptional regulator [Clostridium sp.]|uniref:sigma-54 interaction domain-containing protein n=1 Tax=Clostridium sp. TaxID=1506 RepID=UPI002FC9B8CD
MLKKIYNINSSILEKKGNLKDFDNIEVEDEIYDILKNFENLIIEQNKVICELKEYEESQITAFVIGDIISDGVCLIDSKGIIKRVNKGYLEITGLKSKHLINESLEYLIEKRIITDPVSGQVLIEEKKKTSLAVVNNKKVVITANPFFNKDGKLVEVLTVMRDLTEILKLKGQLEEIEKEKEEYLNELNYLKSKYGKNDFLVAKNKKMNEIKELIKYVAKTDVTILVTGETGCGKELVSKEIHDRSKRKDKPYIKVNCAAIPETLIESELFGYEKGAFTGAQNKEKLGMFELAEGGTILLDEIGEMPLSAQSKLLRVLQEREIMRLGGSKSIKIDVRVLAATNQRIEELIEQGKFREDLYYRLNVVPIRIPPLRERVEDIAILSQSFLEKFNKKYEKEKSFHRDAILLLESYSWPGNVRELQNVIERLVVLDDDKHITGQHITNVISVTEKPTYINKTNCTLKEAVDRVEREIIENALNTYGSTYKAAEVLGVTQPTVFRKAKALGISLKKESK